MHVLAKSKDKLQYSLYSSKLDIGIFMPQSQKPVLRAKYAPCSIAMSITTTTPLVHWLPCTMLLLLLVVLALHPRILTTLSREETPFSETAQKRFRRTTPSASL